MGRKLADDGIAVGNIFLKNTKRLAGARRRGIPCPRKKWLRNRQALHLSRQRNSIRIQVKQDVQLPHIHRFEHSSFMRLPHQHRAAARGGVSRQFLRPIFIVSPLRAIVTTRVVPSDFTDSEYCPDFKLLPLQRTSYGSANCP
jgi:hypothetical protein